ncbi:hypothetical protein Pst134EA_009366 [Puccinia striiformis f. sp. tritici]|uniref:hypothetical protein n=1 Tax=Puccinia striiformis f. sp. tritici TaxID=168172 RepID=UPI0020082066|nr:hypothetical protein Pst134EA_009366 [Puccinia striiformis f. sp. tritici]KAH9468837.1 hypothetical protein Pst134EA_009366 [Puccinia striiformis f. sp. tritici]
MYFQISMAPHQIGTPKSGTPWKRTNASDDGSRMTPFLKHHPPRKYAIQIKPVIAGKEIVRPNANQNLDTPFSPSANYSSSVTSAKSATLAQTVEASSGVINFEEPPRPPSSN